MDKHTGWSEKYSTGKNAETEMAVPDWLGRHPSYPAKDCIQSFFFFKEVSIDPRLFLLYSLCWESVSGGVLDV